MQLKLDHREAKPIFEVSQLKVFHHVFKVMPGIYTSQILQPQLPDLVNTLLGLLFKAQLNFMQQVQEDCSYLS